MISQCSYRLYARKMIIVLIAVALAFLLNLVFISQSAMSNQAQISQLNGVKSKLLSEILEVDRAISNISVQIQLLSAEQRKLYAARQEISAQLSQVDQSIRQGM